MKDSMPKVCFFQVVARPIVKFSLALGVGFPALAITCCNQEKPQELNPSSAPFERTAPPAVLATSVPATVPMTNQAMPAVVASSEPNTTPPALPGSATEPAIPLLPSSEPVAMPATAPATKSADADAAFGLAARSYTGVLHGGVMATGSETTGWALNVDGVTGTLDVDVTAISGQVKALDGRHVTITGQLKQKNWVERGKTQLLIADTIEVAPLPEMNK
jgi:hypothetical protein